MDGPVVMHLFLHEGPRIPEVRAALRALPRSAELEVEVHETSGHALDAAARARQQHGGLPIGFLVTNEASALDALAGGADEAWAASSLEPRALHDFLGRLVLRSRVRREHERMTENVAQADKLAALGTLVAGIGHEINNPLSAISLSIEAARRVLLPLLQTAWELDRASRNGQGLSPPELARIAQTLRAGKRALDGDRLLDDMSTATAQIADVVADLRVFARSDPEERPVLVDVPAVVDQAVRLVGRDLARKAVIERDFPDDLPVLAVPRSRIAQVLTNLLVNAAHAIAEVERPMHRVRITARADAQFVAISVSDTGPGIPPDMIERVFDPFYPTKPQDSGTGLGLSISRSILRRMGGDLVAESVLGEGATFVCMIPRPSREAVKEAYLRSSPPSGSLLRPTLLSILVVDDDERVLRAVARCLGPRHRLLLARDGREAIELLDSGSHADVVLTELELPETDGFALLEHLRAHHPLLLESAIAMTASGQDPELLVRLSSFAIPVLEKPLKPDQLTAAIEQTKAAGDAEAHRSSRDAVG